VEDSEWLEGMFRDAFHVGVFRWLEDGASVDFLGERHVEEKDAVLVDQWQYAAVKLKEVPLAAGRWKSREAFATEEEVSDFRTGLGGAAWVTGRTRPELQYETSVAASAVNSLQIKHIVRLNKCIRMLKDTKQRYAVRVPRLRDAPLKVVVVVDAGEREPIAGAPPCWQSGRLIGLMNDDLEGSDGWFSTVDFKSGKCRRVCHGAFDGETVAAIEGLDTGLAVAMIVEESAYGVKEGLREELEWRLDGGEEVKRPPCLVEVHTDSKSLTTNVESVKIDAGLNKRRKMDVADIQECRKKGELKRLVHIQGTLNPVDPLTKERSRTKQTTERLVELLKSGWYSVPRS